METNYFRLFGRFTMADDKTNKGQRDRDRINLSERYEVDYWKNKFGVSEEGLHDAVQRVGSTVKAVEEELRRKKAS